MKKTHHLFSSGFTLTEVIIAIGVLTILLTGFIAIFTPAAQGIRRSISLEQADRLSSALEQELVSIRKEQTPLVTSGFDKAFTWIRESGTSPKALVVYQYRANPSQSREDGSPEPFTATEGKPGQDYTVQSMARRVDDALLAADLQALEGSFFFVKIKQLKQEPNGLSPVAAGQIMNSDSTPATSPEAYTEAAIAFTAEFYNLPAKTSAYLTSDRFKKLFESTTNKPIFIRNLAIRR